MLRTTRRALVMCMATALAALAATATSAAGFIGQPSGVMPDGPGGPSRHLALPFAAPDPGCPFSTPSASCNMTYHGGDVVHTNTTRVVYWEPAGSAVSANYHSLIERFLGDVAADSGRATNVYATDTQYTDTTNGNILYSQTYAGAFTDTNAFPATQSGCPLTDGTNTVTSCLTQTQLSTELDNFIQTNSLPRGLTNLYFLVLPRGVETCYDDFSDCGNILDISPRYCAYHSSFNISSHGLTIWANEPYIGFASGHCASSGFQRPNGDEADVEINPLSHEHNEIITDPTGGGWFDVDGSGENGDKCNFNFGTAIGSNANGSYNQLINHNPYTIQLEWDNETTGCLANFHAADPTAAFTSSPASPKAGDSVAFDGTGSHSNNTGGYIIDYAWDFGDAGTGTGASPSHTYGAPGTYNVKLTVKDDAGLTNDVTHQVTVVKRPTTTAYTGATTGDYHDSVTLSATLTDTGTSGALSGKSISFTLGSQSCSGTTDASGSASCSLTLDQIPGAYTVSASFAGDSVYDTSGDSKPFTITREETTTTYTGATVILAGGSGATLTGQLLEDGSASSPIAGRTLTLSLGSQSCSGTTDATGTASCTVTFTGALGSQALGASFAGDSYYLPSSDTSKTAIVFAFPSRGAFTLGDGTVAAATPTTKVTWWSNNWSLLNTTTGGLAPSAFKGFADVVSLPTSTPPAACGGPWRSTGGNSPPPTSGVPSYMGVLVTHRVTKSGSTISGDTTHIVVVRVNPGYAPNPSSAGTGVIVATYC